MTTQSLDSYGDHRDDSLSQGSGTEKGRKS